MMEWWNNGVVPFGQKEGSWKAMKLGSRGNNYLPDPIVLALFCDRLSCSTSYFVFIVVLI
jgi:hypothetical protein